MWNSVGKVVIVLGLCLTIGFSWGCMGSSVYRMWYRDQWSKDEEVRPSLYTRLDELAALRSRASKMTEAEQQQTAENLGQALKEDSTPLYRAQVVRTLAELSVPAASDALRVALQDADSQVRVEACAAWGRRGTDDAVGVLAEVLAKDSDLDVRIAAARHLENYRQPEVVPALGVALDDANPALQHRAIQTLRAVTGKDFGNNVAAWQQFVRTGELHAAEPPSLAERLRELF